MSQTLRQVYEVYIRTTPEKLWQALTDPAMTKQCYDTAVESSWKPVPKLANSERDNLTE
jgi:hypothetical protein